MKRLRLVPSRFICRHSLPTSSTRYKHCALSRNPMEAPSIWGRSISDLSDKDSLAAPARQEGPEDPHTIGVYALTGSAFAEVDTAFSINQKDSSFSEKISAASPLVEPRTTLDLIVVTGSDDENANVLTR